MIITPAKFEDEMKAILSGDSKNKGQDMMLLMFDTLKSLGYGAGIKAITEVHNDGTGKPGK